MTGNNKENSAIFDNYRPKMSSHDNNNHKIINKYYSHMRIMLNSFPLIIS